MITAILKKVFDDHDKDSITTPSNFIPSFDKFALKSFNWLFYDCKISRSLVVNYLFSLSDHYLPKVIMKTINIALL